MKTIIKQVFSIQSSVFKLFLLVTVGCGLWTEFFAQDNIYATGGRTKVLEWKSAGDYSDYSLLFVAVDSNDDRVLQKILAKSYTNGYTTMICTLFVSDTEDLTFDASYNYDIAAYGVDTLQVRRGLFNLIDPVQTSFNGINLPADGTRFYVAGTFIDNTVADSALFRYDETTHSIVPIEKEDVWNFLSVSDTVQAYVDDLQNELDSIVEANNYYSLTFNYPIGGEELFIEKTDFAFTIDSVVVETRDSAITFNIKYLSDWLSVGTNVFGSYQTVTTQTTLTSFTNATIPENNYLVFIISNVTGVYGEVLFIKIYYRL